MILILQQVDIEGPETLKPFFEKNGFEVRVLRLYDDGRFPDSADGIDAVIALGGPMNVYEEEKYPFLKDEDIFIRQVLQEQIPYLGICLGAQLLAKAAGAVVGKSPQKEHGFAPVFLTPSAADDPLFAGCAQDIEVFHWHEDMAGVPGNGALLAGSSGCPNQAFRAGKKAYGLQFHIEITDKSIRDWCGKSIEEGDPSMGDRKREMLERYAGIKETFHRTAERIYNNFLKIIKESKNASCAGPDQHHRR